MLKLIAILALLTSSAFATNVTIETYSWGKHLQSVTYKAFPDQNGGLVLEQSYTDDVGTHQNQIQLLKGEQTDLFVYTDENGRYPLSKATLIDKETLKISFASKINRRGKTQYRSYLVNIGKLGEDGSVIPRVFKKGEWKEVRLLRIYGKFKTAPFRTRLRRVRFYADQEGEERIGSRFYLF